MAGFTITVTLSILIINADAKTRVSTAPDRLDYGTTDDSVKFPQKRIPLSTLHQPDHRDSPVPYNGYLNRNNFPLYNGKYRQTSGYSQADYSPFHDSYTNPNPSTVYLPSKRISSKYDERYPLDLYRYQRNLDGPSMRRRDYRNGYDDNYEDDYQRNIGYSSHSGNYQVPSTRDDFGQSVRREDNSFVRDGYTSDGYRRGNEYSSRTRTHDVTSKRDSSTFYEHPLKRDDYAVDDDPRKYSTSSHSGSNGMSSKRGPYRLNQLLMNRDSYPTYGNGLYDNSYQPRNNRMSRYWYPAHLNSKDRDNYPVDDYIQRYDNRGHSANHEMPKKKDRSYSSRYSLDLDDYPDYNYQRKYDYRSPSDNRQDTSYSDQYSTHEAAQNMKSGDYSPDLDDYPGYGYRQGYDHRILPEDDQISNNLASSSSFDDHYRGRHPYKQYSFIGIRSDDDSIRSGRRDNYIMYPRHDYKKTRPSADYLDFGRGSYQASERLPDSERNHLPYPSRTSADRYGRYPYDYSNTDDRVAFSLSGKQSLKDIGPSSVKISSDSSVPYVDPPKNAYAKDDHSGTVPYTEDKVITGPSVSSTSDVDEIRSAQAHLKNKLIAYDRLLEKYKTGQNLIHKDYDDSDKHMGNYGADPNLQPIRNIDTAYYRPDSKLYDQISNRIHETPSYTDSYSRQVTTIGDHKVIGDTRRGDRRNDDDYVRGTIDIAYDRPDSKSYSQISSSIYETPSYTDSSTYDTDGIRSAQAHLKNKLTAYDRLLDNYKTDKNLVHKDYDDSDKHKGNYGSDYNLQSIRNIDTAYYRPDSKLYGQISNRIHETPPYTDSYSRQVTTIGDHKVIGDTRRGDRRNDVDYVRGTIDIAYDRPDSKSYGQISSSIYETPSYTDSYSGQVTTIGDHKVIGNTRRGDRRNDVDYASVLHAEVYEDPTTSSSNKGGIKKVVTSMDSRPVRRQVCCSRKTSF